MTPKLSEARKTLEFWGEKLKGLGGNGKKSLQGAYCVRCRWLVTYIRNTAQVEKFTWEKLRSDRDFFQFGYLKQDSPRSWGLRCNRRQIIKLLLVVSWMGLMFLLFYRQLLARVSFFSFLSRLVKWQAIIMQRLYSSELHYRRAADMKGKWARIFGCFFDQTECGGAQIC